jgi:HlyD family secretion protein
MATALVIIAGAGCAPHRDDHVQGYVEGEFVYVASPLPGALEKLSVDRGTRVNAGDPLFTLESGAELAERDEAVRRLAQGRAQLADVKKGKRPVEIAAVEAQLQQAQAALALAEKEFARQQTLVRSGASATNELDRARATRDQDRERVAQLEADVQTAKLAARTDQVTAAEANVRALEASLAKAEWNLSQKKQAAPTAGLIFDTFYREGEWVPAGRPVLALLPPANLKVRAFVPQAELGKIQLGDAVKVHIDGAGDVTGTIRFISPEAEYTPPVIYSQDSRSKLVFLVEINFAPEIATRLHPGQPVDVYFSQTHAG